jgi:hypothetical protein
VLAVYSTIDKWPVFGCLLCRTVHAVLHGAHVRLPVESSRGLSCSQGFQFVALVSSRTTCWTQWLQRRTAYAWFDHTQHPRKHRRQVAGCCVCVVHSAAWRGITDCLSSPTSVCPAGIVRTVDLKYIQDNFTMVANTDRLRLVSKHPLRSGQSSV